MKLQNKQQRNMEKNYCQRMKYFVLVDHVHSHLLLSKARPSVHFSSSDCRTVHLPKPGSLQLFSVSGWNTSQQNANGRSQDLTKHPALQQLKASEQPQAELHPPQIKGCSSLWSRIGNQKHHNSSIKASKSTFRAIAPLCALSPNAVTDLTGNTRRKEMLQRQNIAQQHSAYAVLIRCQL